MVLVGIATGMPLSFSPAPWELNHSHLHPDDTETDAQQIVKKMYFPVLTPIASMF